MIKIENISLFGIEYATCYNGDNVHTLINITVDPEVVELKSYRRTPFASIIINSEDVAMSVRIASKPDFTNQGKYDIKRDIFNIIKNVLKTSKLTVINSYIDDEYDKYKKCFPDMNFHTVILYVDANTPSDVSDKSILIGGYPIRGFVSPIHKSPEYLLLNGAFITTKLFSMKDVVYKEEPWKKNIYGENDFLYYDKILYVYTDIKTKFEIHEYMKVSDELGIVCDYQYTPEYVSRLDEETKEEYLEFDITHNVSNRYIPVVGREYLFQKSDKNMFHLSDIPNDIMMQRHTISKKI